MVKNSAQMEMFSIGEDKGKKKKEFISVNQNLTISRHLLIYLILGILVLFTIVYIAGVETGRRWKVDKIYKEYIKEKK